MPEACGAVIFIGDVLDRDSDACGTSAIRCAGIGGTSA
jgi:hypothetical protein